MAQTFATIRTFVDNSVPGTAPNYTTVRDEAIKLAVALASPDFREELYQEFTAKDGTTTRYALVGRDIEVKVTPETPTATGINTAGVPAPTTLPSLSALPSGGTLAAGLYYWGYCYTTARGDTQMSPLASVTVAGSGRITRGVVALPANVTGIKDFLSTEPLDADVRLNGSGAVSGAAVTVTAAATVGGPSPFVDHTPLTSFLPLVTLEEGVDVDGSANPLVTTLTLATAPAAGNRFRVWYTRKPLVPANANDTIALPDEWIKNAALFYVCQLLGLSHESGDATRFAQVAAALDPVIVDLKTRGSSHSAPTVIASSWAV